MRCYPEKFPALLEKGDLAPVYLIAGDEPFQLGEAGDAVRDAARRQGFGSREVFFVERGFDWNALIAATRSLSLFAEKRLLELRLPTGKPGDAGGKALQEFAANPPEDTVLMISSARVDGRAKWVKALEEAGVFVEVWPVDREQLPRWIIGRLQRHDIRADADAARLLADRVEGNLLAAAQEVEKLALLLDGGEADADTVRQIVADSARYDVFQLVDAALAGQADRALRVLDGLRSEGVEPVLVSWALLREIRANTELAFRLSRGEHMGAVTSRVWPRKRQNVVAGALERLRLERWEDLLLAAALAERKVKGASGNHSRNEVWAGLERLVAAMAGKPPVRKRAS